MRIAFSALIEGREGKIARYQFLENTFDVSLAFQLGRIVGVHDRWQDDNRAHRKVDRQ